MQANRMFVLLISVFLIGVLLSPVTAYSQQVIQGRFTSGGGISASVGYRLTQSAIGLGIEGKPAASEDYRLSSALIRADRLINTPPVAEGQDVATATNTPVSITLTGSDIDGDNLSFSLVVWPEHGTLTGTPPNLTYTPEQDYRGTDSFTFKAHDGQVDSGVATVHINIESANTPPAAKAQQITAQEDTATSITLVGSDPDGDPLTFSLLTQPTHGKLEGIPPNLTYTPEANYNGTDSFTFKANDGIEDSETATVTLTVTPVNDPPVAIPQSLTMPEDGDPLAITLTGEDVDGDKLSFRVVVFPTHGTWTGNAPNLSYTPLPNYNGPDSLQFKASDGLFDSEAVSIDITVTPVNDPPVATPQTLSTPENKPLPVTLTGTDVDGDALTFSIVSQPSHGKLTGTAPNLSYTPEVNYNGTDSFTFKANDGTVDSPPATVNLTITPVNDRPIADAQSLSLNEDEPLDITLTGKDPEGKSVTFKIVRQPEHGALTGNTPTITYTPAQDYYGEDSFSFKTNDGWLDSDPAEVSLRILPINDPPVAHELDVTVNEDDRVAFQLEGHDVDGDSIFFSVVSQPAHGTLEGFPPHLEYVPVPDYNGEDNFTYKANDGVIDSEEDATVHLHITPVNDRPVAYPQTGGDKVTTDEDTEVPITLTWKDVDGDIVTFKHTQPEHGTLTGNPPNLSYKPDANYYGDDGFQFQVHDGILPSTWAKVDILIKSVNDKPEAYPQQMRTRMNTPVSITLEGDDADGDLLTFQISVRPKYGTLTGTPPNLTYTPTAEYNGKDSFTFVVNDGSVMSEPSVVEIDVLLFVDANLELAVREALQVGVNEPLTDGLLELLTNLTAFDRGIGDLSGLERCVHLQTLNLANNTVGDLSPLSSLKELKVLNLTNNDISDIKPLRGLTHLQTLSLSGNSIEQVSALSGLSALTLLFLGGNQIADLSPLVQNVGLGDGDRVDVRGNPLNAQSVSHHIPALRARGVEVLSDAVLVGDVDGDGQLTAQDASLILQSVVGLVELTSEQVDTADVSEDGSVTSLDAALILIMLAGKM